MIGSIAIVNERSAMTKSVQGRRLFMTGISALAVLSGPARTLAGEVMKDVAALKPGVAASITWPLLYRSRLAESERFMAMHEVEGAPNAETAIELIDRRGHWGHYRLQPVTGQKHQLRAHLNALGIPILHDQIYPELLPALPPDVLPDFSRPLQLLAESLAFEDPITGQPRAFHCGRGLV